MTRKTGSDNKAIGCWLVPSTCMLKIGEAIVWVKIEVYVMWCGVVALPVRGGVSIWIVLSRVIFSVLSLGSRVDIAVMRR